MPLSGERPDALSVSPPRLPMLLRVVLRVLLGGDALQILQRVVERITVAVVDVVPVWDRSVRSFPDGAVEQSVPVPVVDARCAFLRFRVPREADPLKDDGVLHPSNLTHHTLASSGGFIST